MKIPGVFYNAKSFRDVPAGTVIFEEGASGAEMFGRESVVASFPDRPAELGEMPPQART